jgi:thymidylate kinase
MLNRLAEEWYRQLLSCWYEHRGYVVIYDRHYAFDFEYNPGRQLRLTERIHRWMLANHYPRPDLVLFLDAPPEVLYARKHEWGVPRLQARREALLRQGARTRDFVRIDAAQPLNAVYADVAAHIQTLCSTREVNRA